MEVTTGAVSRAKLQSNRHHQQTNTHLFLQACCPSCRQTKSVKALKGSIYLFLFYFSFMSLLYAMYDFIVIFYKQKMNKYLFVCLLIN